MSRILFSSQSDTTVLELPCILDKQYLLEREIGRGKFGFVTLGHKRDAAKGYAVKCIVKYKLNEKERVRLDREINAMKRLSHPFARDLINAYWAQNPSDRPSFEQICSMLAKKAHFLLPDSELDRLFAFMSNVI